MPRLPRELPGACWQPLVHRPGSARRSGRGGAGLSPAERASPSAWAEAVPCPGQAARQQCLSLLSGEEPEFGALSCAPWENMTFPRLWVGGGVGI